MASRQNHTHGVTTAHVRSLATLQRRQAVYTLAYNMPHLMRRRPGTDFPLEQLQVVRGELAQDGHRRLAGAVPKAGIACTMDEDGQVTRHFFVELRSGLDGVTSRRRLPAQATQDGRCCKHARTCSVTGVGSLCLSPRWPFLLPHSRC